MPTSEEQRESELEAERQAQRWWLLRWGPRHDSGVLYARDHPGEVWASTIAEVVPFLVSTSDFAPADMQYRMHREHLWDPYTGLYGEAFNVDSGTWVREVPTASGNALVALAMAHALREGGTGIPAEMRGRWQRETRALIAAIAEQAPESEPAHMLSRAQELGREDGWLE